MTIICEHTGNSLGIEEANSQYKQEQERKTPPLIVRLPTYSH